MGLRLLNQLGPSSGGLIFVISHNFLAGAFA